MLELTVLLISTLLVLIAIYFWSKDTTPKSVENFEGYFLKSCPPGYKSFYNNDGNMICCNGDVFANKCLGDNQCTLNGSGSEEMPNCVMALLKMYEEKGKSQCPPSMPQYFEDTAHNVKACTQGRLNQTLNSPQFGNQPTCIIYDTWDKNRNSKDSCYNQKMLDAAQCFGNNCTKELTQPIPTAPPLVAIGFTDNTGMHRVAYTRQSLESFLDVSNPSWRNQGMDLSTNINVAEVAKAYYVDRTMDQSAVQF
jgi:hypothetical protein